jgi:elongation factor G
MEMDHYDVVPQPIAEKVLASAKRPGHEDEEE